jgi:tetrahydromethanopterin S-methyltransferase subunit G
VQQEILARLKQIEQKMDDMNATYEGIMGKLELLENVVKADSEERRTHEERITSGMEKFFAEFNDEAGKGVGSVESMFVVEEAPM